MKDVDGAYAIVRYDFYKTQDGSPQDRITIKEIVWSLEEADQEVERLNNLRKDSTSRYFWQYTRVKRREQCQDTSLTSQQKS